MRYVVVPLLVLVLASCASKPAETVPATTTAPPAPVPQIPPPAVAIQSARATALDLVTVRFSAEVVVSNPADEPVDADTLNYVIAINSVPVLDGAIGIDSEIDGGGTVSVPVDVACDLRDASKNVPGLLDAAQAEWSLQTTIVYHRDRSGSHEATATYHSTFPIVHAPTVEISHLKIEKWELVNTRLDLTLSITNPNAFPLAFDSVEYLFYGEGKAWASGENTMPQELAASRTTDVDFPVVMNFIEMGRDLFDLVEKLQIVRYRLKGTADVGTPLEFLPRFELPFDLSGTRKVER